MNDGTPVDNLRLPANSLGYSLRRYFVDAFHFRHVPGLPAGSRVLDLGGTKLHKRGQFDVERYGLRVVYINLSAAKRPDVQGDAARLPFCHGTFDVVICSELLEHVADPRAVLEEAFRVLEEGGRLLICVPFLHHIHGDPYDYGRYTDFYWSEVLATIGLKDIQIEKQGLFWSVLVDMLCDLADQKTKAGQLRPAWARRLLAQLVRWGRRKALAWDTSLTASEDPFMSSFTTGFGILAFKPNSLSGESSDELVILASQPTRSND